MVTKKAPAKKASVKKPVSKPKSAAVRKPSKNTVTKKTATMRSFRVSPNVRPFISVGLTRQTIYWTILLIFVLVMQLWILKIQLDIVSLTNSITAQ